MTANPVTPVTNGAVVSASNPLPVALTGGIPDTGLTQTMDAEGEVLRTITLTPATSGAAPWMMGITSDELNSVWNTYVGMGFNLLSYPPFNTGGGRTASQPTFVAVMENNYYDATHHYMEYYLDYRSPDDSTVTFFRPLFVNVWRDDNNSRTAEPRFDIGNSSGSFRVFASGVDADNPAFLVSSAEVRMFADNVNITKGALDVTRVANGNCVIQVGSNVGTGNNGIFRVKGGDGRFNFQIGGLIDTNNSLEITPSTAAEGSTYSNPAFAITSGGSVLLGKAADIAALATDATTGFAVIPGSAGLQTGTPANAGTGQFAMAYDSTNNKIMVYNGAWRSTAALT
jgi:hypothetical protein